MALNLKETLVAEARALGFALCKVAKCAAPPHAPQFDAWLDQGYEGEMAWLRANRERRVDPQKVLPGARAVIILAMNYWQGGETPSPRIARYAWGDDYHDLMAKKLRQLNAILEGFGGAQKCYVDTGPMLERDFAAQAGVGWHGKSTMLIHPEFGTWLFLAEILTTLALEEDAPLPDRCGSCTRCITACPTAAIVAPRVLDARRCISYLTIELKGSIPVELRPLIGDRVYGCDDCLSACPWNRFAQVSHEASFAARPATTGMALAHFLALTDEQFHALFRKSPIKRIKRRGFLRNVCVALGNVGTARDLPALRKAAADPEPLIAEHAAWAITRIESRE